MEKAEPSCLAANKKKEKNKVALDNRKIKVILYSKLNSQSNAMTKRVPYF